MPLLLCCGCLSNSSGLPWKRQTGTWAADWWPSRSRNVDTPVARLDAPPDKQPAAGSITAESEGVVAAKTPPPVVTTQDAAPAGEADLTPAKAELSQQRPDATARPTFPPGMMPAAEPREATNAPAAPGPEGGGPPGTGKPAAPAGLAGVPPGQPPPFQDPHQRLAPTATGALLNVPPGGSIAERALELSARLATAEADRKALEARISLLTAAVESRDQELQAAGREVQEATDEVVRTRKQLQDWRHDLEAARANSQKQKKEDLEKLRAIITLMEKMLENSPSPGQPEKETGGQPKAEK